MVIKPGLACNYRGVLITMTPKSPFSGRAQRYLKQGGTRSRLLDEMSDDTVVSEEQIECLRDL